MRVGGCGGDGGSDGGDGGVGSGGSALHIFAVLRATHRANVKQQKPRALTRCDIHNTHDVCELLYIIYYLYVVHIHMV